MLAYGAIFESENLRVEFKTLPVPFWPEELRGFRIALLADFHLRGPYSMKLCQRAVAATLAADPDMVAIVGDVVSYWAPEFPALVGEMLEPLLMMEGSVVAVYGNHDSVLGPASTLGTIYKELNIKLLQNESWEHKGITWVGVDSAAAYWAEPKRAMEGVTAPAVCLWHEPDLVDRLPKGCSLMVSGHSHGGQFRFPGGYTPMHTDLGRRYPRGFYPKAPTPLYVSQGIGTTGPPSRFLCPPEVSILTLVPLD